MATTKHYPSVFEDEIKALDKIRREKTKEFLADQLRAELLMSKPTHTTGILDWIDN